MNESKVDWSSAPFIPWSDGVVIEHLDNGILKLERRGEDLYANSEKVGLYFSEQQRGGNYLEGHALRKELSDKRRYNANLLDFLIKKENQCLIPESWKGKRVYFWGTIYRRADNRLYSRFLFWDGAEWHWLFSYLEDDYLGDEPAAVSL